MKLAISNIAWDSHENDKMIPLLKKFGVKGIEIAPTKHWDEPATAKETEIANYKEFWVNQGFTPIAMQSLLFNKNQLSIFGDVKKETMNYLVSILTLASKLGIKAVVFGSPKNRLIGGSDREERYGEAIDFFRLLGERATQLGVHLCIEPNPVKYGCDFITTTLEGLDFVKNVKSDGVKLHLDTGTMLLNEEKPELLIPECLPYSGHFHISDPFLNIPGSYNQGHEAIAEVLHDYNYQGWVSIEMKNGILRDNSEALLQALEYVNRHYTQI
ncbi:sugar phosphate isomerase/epimerase family protein [Paenibacillus sp. 2TAB26]|uniref:sugar phosphate isomerase/epimerase family protein n=1 Tax=Paenibacillus sp. 2TAB26 TaxID=3233005 RepID=UPI003F9458F7